MKYNNIIREFLRNDVLNCIESSQTVPSGLKNAHIYITGSSGFLGSWLLEFISILNDQYNYGIRVTCISNSLVEFSKTKEHLFKNKDFSFIENDVRNISEIPSNVTHIIHAAAFTNRQQFSTYPTHVASNNINSTIRVFQLAQNLGELQNILLLSSGLIYGRNPVTSNDLHEYTMGGILPCFDVNQVYSESKRVCEAIAAAFISESKLPITIARPFAFVGPYQSLQLPWAVTDFMRDAFQGGPIKILGDGSTIRSIMYGSDFANWVLNITANGETRSVYNIGSDEGTSLLNLANLIGSHFSIQPQILTSVGNSQEQNDRLVPSIAKANSELNLTITVGLNKAIERSIKWHKLIKGLN